MAGRKELFCASSSPVTLSALINACCTETILNLFSRRSSCCPEDAAHAEELQNCFGEQQTLYGGLKILLDYYKHRKVTFHNASGSLVGFISSAENYPNQPTRAIE